VITSCSPLNVHLVKSDNGKLFAYFPLTPFLVLSSSKTAPVRCTLKTVLWDSNRIAYDFQFKPWRFRLEIELVRAELNKVKGETLAKNLAALSFCRNIDP